MKPEKVWAALRLYDEYLLKRGYSAVQMPEDAYDRPRLVDDVLLCHCRWMAQKCLTAFRLEYEAAWDDLGVMDEPVVSPGWLMKRLDAAADPLEKAMRWLGYIQGVLNARGHFSCNQLRDHSRGGEGEFRTPAQEHGGAVPPVPDLTDGQLDRARMDGPPAPDHGVSSDGDRNAE